MTVGIGIEMNDTLLPTTGCTSAAIANDRGSQNSNHGTAATSVFSYDLQVPTSPKEANPQFALFSSLAGSQSGSLMTPLAQETWSADQHRISTDTILPGHLSFPPTPNRASGGDWPQVCFNSCVALNIS